MLRISSTYLASGNFLCTFCKRWRREGRQFQVMAFTQGFERRYITSCQNTIKWTMTRLPYMSDVKHASNYTSRIDQRCLKKKAGGEALTSMKHDGRSTAISLLNYNVSQKTSERGDRKQIHSGKIECALSLIERKNQQKRMISKAVKVLPEESLVKRNQRLSRQSEAQKLKTWEKFGKTEKIKTNYKIFGAGNPSDRIKSTLRPGVNTGKNEAIWDRLTTDKAERAFVEFQEMLKVPQSTHGEQFLHEQHSQKKAKPVKKKMVNVFKVSDPHVKQRLQKNKINVEIYDQTHLLKVEEPQCEFAEVQCGRKKLYIAFLEDGAPENVADKLPMKASATQSNAFAEKLMTMTPTKLSRVTPEKIVKMIRGGRACGGKLVKMIHDKPPNDGPDKPRNGGRDRSLQLKIPRKSTDLKVVVNLKKPQESMSCPTIHFKQKTPNGIVLKTMKLQIKKMEKYLFLTNNGKIRIQYLTGGLTNIKQRLIEKIEIPRILQCPVAVSGQGKIMLFEKMEDSSSTGTVRETSETSHEKPKESIIQKIKLLNVKQEEKPEVNKETERKYLFKILKRKPRKVANEKVDEGKLIEAKLNNRASETFSKFDTLLHSMTKPKDILENETKLEVKSDLEKIPEESPPSEEKTLLPVVGPSYIAKEEVIQENKILPKPKPKTLLPTWKEIRKINHEKQEQLSKIPRPQPIDPYFVQLQQQKLKQKEIHEQVISQAGPTSVPNQPDSTYEGRTLPAEEQVQQLSQTAQANLTLQEATPLPNTHENTHQGVESLSSSQQDQTNHHSQQLQETPSERNSPNTETQPTFQTSEGPLDQSRTSNLPQFPQNNFYYPEIRNQRSRRPSLPPPFTDKGTNHFVSTLPEQEQKQSLARADVKVPPVFTDREAHMYETQLEETINKPLIEDMKLKDPEIVLREDLPEYLPKDIINKWEDKNWNVREKWETRMDKIPNLRKLVRANSGNADYIHSFIIESDTLGECYRSYRQTPDFTPKTSVEYSFKYDQEPEMRMFENVVAQNFTRVDDPDYIQVKRLQNDQAKVETSVTNVTVIHPEVKITPEVSNPPQNPIHSFTESPTQNPVIANVLGTSAEGTSYISREQIHQVAENKVNADAGIKPILQKHEHLDMRRNHVTMPYSSRTSEAREVMYPENHNPDLSQTQNIPSIGFRLGGPEEKFSTRTSVENAPRQRLEGGLSLKALSEENKGGINREYNKKTVEKQEKGEIQENAKTLAPNPGKNTTNEVKPSKASDKPKHKQEEDAAAKKPKETLAAIADASSEKNNKPAEAKSKKSTEKAKEETDSRVKEEIVQKLKDELSSKLRNEWKVKLFDELADRIKPVIELKLTSDKPKNQIYLEKAKSEKLEAQREQPQVKDQLKEELKELKEELKKMKMKEELKQELKSELKGEFTSRTVADIQALNSEPVQLKAKKMNEGENVPRMTESVQMTTGQKVSTVKDEQLEKVNTRNECDYCQNSVSVMAGWGGHHFSNEPVHLEERKEDLTGRSDVQNHDDPNNSISETPKFEQTAENDAENDSRHLPEREHPYLPQWNNPPGTDIPKKEPQTKPRDKDHPYLPRWDPLPQRTPPSEPVHPQPQPTQPYYPHTQPPNQPFQPLPQTPNQPYQPYQPQPQQPVRPSHPQPQTPNQPYEPQPQPPSQPQTPYYSLHPSHHAVEGASQYENEVNRPHWNQGISTPKEETSTNQDDHGERSYKEEAQPQKSWEPSSLPQIDPPQIDPPQIDEVRTQPSHFFDDEALSQSRQKYFKITLPETKMEEGKRTEDLKAKQKEEKDLGKKKEDERIINQQSRTKFFRGLIPEKKNPEEKPDERIQKEENQGKKYFRTLLQDQKTPGKFMKFKGDQKKAKGTRKEESEKGKPNKKPGEIKLKELPPTKPEIKKSSDNKPAEILVKSIETLVEQSIKSEMGTAKQVEAAEQKKLIKHQEEAGVQKELGTKKQLEASEQKELLRQQQEAAAKRELEIRKHQEERDRQQKEAIEAKKNDEILRRVPGIAGYGTIILEQDAMPVVRIPPDRKPDDSKDERSSDEKKVKFPGPETKTEKKSHPDEKVEAKKEETTTKSEGKSVEMLKSFMDPLKFGKILASTEKQSLEEGKQKPSSAEASPKKEVDKKEKPSPLQEWERKILGGSDKSKIDEGKKDKMAAKVDTEKGVHDKPKAPDENSKLVNIGKRKSDLSDWEKEIDEQTSSFYGGAAEPMKTADGKTIVKEEKQTKQPDLPPRKEESPTSDKTPKMYKEDDSEVLQARVEHYINIYDPPNKGEGGTDSGSPNTTTTTMTLPDIEEYNRSDQNDFFSAGLKTSDFNLYLSQEEAEEIHKYNQVQQREVQPEVHQVQQIEPVVHDVPLDQTNANPLPEEMNLLHDPAWVKSEAAPIAKEDSSVHVGKVTFEDNKTGAGEENKPRSLEEADEKQLRSFAELLKSVLSSKQQERVNIFPEKEANSKKKTDGEKETASDLNLCKQLLEMAITNARNEIFHNKSHAKTLTDSENNYIHVQPLVQLLKRTITSFESGVSKNEKQAIVANLEAEKERGQLEPYLELFRTAVDAAEHESKEKRTTQTGAGDVRGGVEADFRSFLGFLKEEIAKLDSQTQEAISHGEQISKKTQNDHVTGDLGVVHASKKNTSVDRAESVKNKISSDQSEISTAKKEAKKWRTKLEESGNDRITDKEKMSDVEAQSDDHPELKESKKELAKKTREAGEEVAEDSKKTIKVDKIIVNIKADPEGKETTEKRRKPSRKMARKMEEIPEEEISEKQEKSTRKKKYRKKNFEEDTMSKTKQEFLEEKRKRKLASEEDSQKLSKTVPEKEPELEPGSTQMSEIAEETTLVHYNSPQGEESNRSYLEVREVSPKPKRESFMSENVMKEFTIREEPFDIELVQGKNKPLVSKRDVQCVEGNIRAARVDKSYVKEGKSGKYLRTILPDTVNVDIEKRFIAEEEQAQKDAGSTRPEKKTFKTLFEREQSRVEEIQKALKEEKSDEEPVKLVDGKRDAKGYVKSPKKNMSGITQKRDLQTLATVMSKNTDEKRGLNRLITRKLTGSSVEEESPVGESVLGDALRHKIASAPYRKTELTYSEKEMLPIKDKTELKTVRVFEEVPDVSPGKQLIEAVAKKANEIPCAVARDPENLSPPIPPPVLAGAVLSPKGRKPKKKFWLQKMENGNK